MARLIGAELHLMDVVLNELNLSKLPNSTQTL